MPRPLLAPPPAVAAPVVAGGGGPDEKRRCGSDNDRRLLASRSRLRVMSGAWLLCFALALLWTVKTRAAAPVVPLFASSLLFKDDDDKVEDDDELVRCCWRRAAASRRRRSIMVLVGIEAFLPWMDFCHCLSKITPQRSSIQLLKRNLQLKRGDVKGQ
jgi:hypothetical protein